MGHEIFHPRTAIREEKRQANEALGRSFCKTMSEPITNSDSSSKRKLGIAHASGLVELMLEVPKGSQMDTAALKTQLVGKYPKRRITIEIVTAKATGRPAGEVVIIDEGEGMSHDTLHKALDEIGGDKLSLSRGVLGRNLFGRGLSDVLRVHTHPLVQTWDGKQLSVATGKWDPKKGYWVSFNSPLSPSPFVRQHNCLAAWGRA